MAHWQRVALAACAAAAVIVPSAGLAQTADEKGFYIGGSVGEAKAKEFCDTGGIAGLTVTGCSNKETAYKIFAGYQFMRNLAVEATYLKVDDFSATFTFGGASGRATGDGTSFSIAGVGILPLGDRFSLFGKIGVAKTEVDTSGNIGAISVSSSDDETEAHYGVGAVFHLTKKWGIRAEWEKLDDSKVEMMSIGVQFRF